MKVSDDDEDGDDDDVVRGVSRDVESLIRYGWDGGESIVGRGNKGKRTSAVVACLLVHMWLLILPAEDKGTQYNTLHLPRQG